MNEDIKLKRIKLNRKIFKTYILYLLGYYVATVCYHSASDIYIPMMELTLLALKVDENIINSLGKLMYYFFWSLPTVSLVFGWIELRKVAKENFQLRKEEIEYEKMINFEEQKDLVQEVIDKFNNLDRSKQMELLNFVKTDIKNNQGYLFDQINLLEKDGLNLLQKEMEEVLFPSVLLKNEDILCKKRIK